MLRGVIIAKLRTVQSNLWKSSTQLTVWQSTDTTIWGAPYPEYRICVCCLLRTASGCTTDFSNWLLHWNIAQTLGLLSLPLVSSLSVCRAASKLIDFNQHLL